MPLSIVQSHGIVVNSPAFNLGVLELDDLLLTVIEEAADGGEQDVPRLDLEGHIYRRNSASLQGWRMKSTG